MAKIPLGYTQKRYDSTVKSEVKFLFLDRELSPVQIGKQYGGRPSWQCVMNWAKKKDPATGLNWYEEREKKQKDKYLKLSPQQQAQGLMDAVDHMMSVLNNKIQKGSTDVKELSTIADSLSKLNKILEKLVDKKFQVPMLYEFIEKFISFLQLHYKPFVTPEFINAVKHFKNETRKTLEFN